ncbi:hypothetical protein KAT36_04310 [Candidatus Pacearchaeota archaeon]|nr:hypothetical protein [Candidatus Pacearchaeota archaeon]
MVERFLERFDKFLEIKYVDKRPQMYSKMGGVFAYVCEVNKERDKGRISFVNPNIGIIKGAEFSCNPIFTGKKIMEKAIKFYEDFQF